MKKKRVSIFVKLMVPIFLLGLVGLIGSIMGVVSVKSVHTASQEVSGDGIETINEINTISVNFEKMQKMVLALCADPENDELKAAVDESIAAYDEEMLACEETLRQKKELFSDEDEELLNTTFDAIEEAKEEMTGLMELAVDDRFTAFANANTYMAEWATNVGDSLQTLSDHNDQRIEKLVANQKNVVSV
ncbi:MAG: MCP four helix bundle domain-containing protein [Clostridiaceae bacterium]|nr:MCP four helix bundle domain-containing protein [Clostridiaceae bacterium]